MPENTVQRVALVCHPHPQYGGTMHNSVVYHVAKALRERGLAVLRFNFRGVGRSEGTHDLGRGEQDDVRAALDALLARYPNCPCWLAGYSFGAWVGLRVGIDDPRVDGLLAVGMPVNSLDFGDLERCGKRLAVVQGGGDEHGSELTLRAVIGGLTCPAHLEVIEGAGHFFSDRLEELRAAVGRAADFLDA